MEDLLPELPNISLGLTLSIALGIGLAWFGKWATGEINTRRAEIKGAAQNVVSRLKFSAGRAFSSASSQTASVFRRHWKAISVALVVTAVLAWSVVSLVNQQEARRRAQWLEDYDKARQHLAKDTKIVPAPAPAIAVVPRAEIDEDDGCSCGSIFGRIPDGDAACAEYQKQCRSSQLQKSKTWKSK